MQSCALQADNTVIRLYRGNGGATTAFSYSITLDPPGWARERQIFYSYSSPVISGLSCSTDSLGLSVASGAGDISLGSEAIQAAYDGKLISYYRGDAWNPGLQPHRLVAVLLGFTLLCAGAIQSIAFFWRPRSSHAAQQGVEPDVE